MRKWHNDYHQQFCRLLQPGNPLRAPRQTAAPSDGNQMAGKKAKLAIVTMREDASVGLTVYKAIVQRNMEAIRFLIPV